VVQGLAEPFVQVPIMVISTSLIGKAEAGSANALFNTLKTLSTNVGAGLITTLLTRREQSHSARLTESFDSLSGSPLLHQEVAANRPGFPAVGEMLRLCCRRVAGSKSELPS
jgi:MFS transporter, DHA2 family, multidrug resistance protein